MTERLEVATPLESPAHWAAFQGSAPAWHPAARRSRRLSRKELEHFYLERCRAYYPHFPAGMIEASEAPDFLIRTPDRVVGVEITEWHIDPSPFGSRLRRHVEQRLRVLEQAEALYYAKNRAIARVDAFFRETPSKQEVPEAVASLAELVERMSVSLPEDAHAPVPRLFWRSPVLLRLFDRITIWRKAVPVRFGTWRTAVLDPTAALQESIDRKEAKLPSYQRFADENWLIIVAGTSLASTLPPSWRKDGYVSNFNRVLVLEFSRKRVVRLRTGSSS